MLHFIDLFSRFSSTCIVPNKHRDTVIECVFNDAKVSIIANETRNVRCVLVGLMNHQLKVLLKELIFTNLYAVHLIVSLNKILLQISNLFSITHLISLQIADFKCHYEHL